MFLIECLVQSHHDDQIEDLIKRLERKKREEDHENDSNSKTDGVAVDKYDDYEIRVWYDDDDYLMWKRRANELWKKKVL